MSYPRTSAKREIKLQAFRKSLTDSMLLPSLADAAARNGGGGGSRYTGGLQALCAILEPGRKAFRSDY